MSEPPKSTGDLAPEHILANIRRSRNTVVPHLDSLPTVGFKPLSLASV